MKLHCSTTFLSLHMTFLPAPYSRNLALTLTCRQSCLSAGGKREEGATDMTKREEFQYNVTVLGFLGMSVEQRWEWGGGRGREGEGEVGGEHLTVPL